MIPIVIREIDGLVMSSSQPKVDRSGGGMEVRASRRVK